jgi:GNAT superfamily N-acetyltransferase
MPTTKAPDLLRGVRGAARTRIRLMRPTDDLARLSDLHELADGEPLAPDNQYLSTSTGRFVAQFHHTGPAGLWAALNTPGRNIEEAVLGVSCVLVAEAHDGELVGLALAGPPAEVTDVLNRGEPEQEHLTHLLYTVVHVAALAVDPAHQGQGIGASLVRQAREVYTAGGFAIMYGEVRNERAAAFYASRGFELFGPDDGIRLGGVVDDPWFSFYPPEGGRYFARSLRQDYTRPLRYPNLRPTSSM